MAVFVADIALIERKKANRFRFPSKHFVSAPPSPTHQPLITSPIVSFCSYCTICTDGITSVNGKPKVHTKETTSTKQSLQTSSNHNFHLCRNKNTDLKKTLHWKVMVDKVTFYETREWNTYTKIQSTINDNG